MKKKRSRKKYDFKRPIPLIVHTKELSDNLDKEQEQTGKAYTVIMNQRLNESYKTNPLKDS